MNLKLLLYSLLLSTSAVQACPLCMGNLSPDAPPFFTEGSTCSWQGIKASLVKNKQKISIEKNGASFAQGYGDQGKK